MTVNHRTEHDLIGDFQLCAHIMYCPGGHIVSAEEKCPLAERTVHPTPVSAYGTVMLVNHCGERALAPFPGALAAYR